LRRYARAVRIAAILLSSSLLVACKSDKPAAAPAPADDHQCREDVGDDAAMAGKTGVAGAKTGVTTGVEGVKAFGNSAVGLVEGGSDEAKKRWKDGKQETKATAHEGAQETKKESHTPKCGGR
jgi:hypothetical protein